MLHYACVDNVVLDNDLLKVELQPYLEFHMCDTLS